MSKLIHAVAALIMMFLLLAVAILAAPALLLLLPFGFIPGKIGPFRGFRLPLPQPSWGYLASAGVSASLILVTGALYAAAPPFAFMVNGIGIAIGLLPGSLF